MFVVKNSDGGDEPGTFSYDAPSKTLTFTPTTEYRFADTITVTVSGIEGPGSGVQIGTFVFSFKTLFSELLENGDFEAPPAPRGLSPWKVLNKSADKLMCNAATRATPVVSGSCAFKFKGGSGENSKLVQVVDTSGVPLVIGDELILSAHFDNTPKVKLWLILDVKYASLPLETVKQKIPTTSGYVQFTLPAVALDSTDITSITVTIHHKSKTGRSFVDDVSLKLRQGNARQTPGAVLPPPPPGIAGEWRGN
jgi:hypothetical protein